MSNIKRLRIVNILMFIAFMTTLIAIVLYKFSPYAALQGNEVISEIHEWGGISFFLLAVIHISLNFNWIKSQIIGVKNSKKQ